VIQYWRLHARAYDHVRVSHSVTVKYPRAHTRALQVNDIILALTYIYAYTAYTHWHMTGHRGGQSAFTHHSCTVTSSPAADHEYNLTYIYIYIYMYIYVYICIHIYCVCMYAYIMHIIQ
jgi:hypothetical protein